MWLLLLLLIFAVLLAPLVWAMFRVSKLRFVDVRGQIVPPEKVPEAILFRLKKQVDPLVEFGFEYIGMRREARGDDDSWQVLLSSSGGAVWAVAEEYEEPLAGRRLSLVSFGSDKRVVITRDGDGFFGFEEPEAVVESASFSSAFEQAESHAALLASEYMTVAAVDPETFLNQYEQMTLRGLNSLYSRGWLEEGLGGSYDIPPLKLPLIAAAWLKYKMAERARLKLGSSWLLDANFGVVAAEPEPEVEEVLVPVPEEVIAEEVGGGLVGAFAENESAAGGNEVLEAVEEELEAAHPSSEAPQEDGLPRDWALYQEQAQKKTWRYWLASFGSRAFLFLSLLIFSLAMAVSGGWGLRMVVFGLLALLVHEAGHALVMMLRRSWDWSQFILPMPRAMSAKPWLIKGGFDELLTTLAGPLPGLLVGWLILLRAYLGGSTSDFFLDAAFAAIVVNSVTLLPFLPFDGGRLLDLVLLRRVPQLRSVGLIAGALVFFVLAFLGGGLFAAVVGVLLLAGIPAARRKSKLLPWFRSNGEHDGEQQVITAFNISRERSQRKAFNGVTGLARLDELMGLAQSKRMNVLGSVLAIAVLVFSWSAPLVLPVYGVAVNGRQWLNVQEEVKQDSQKYLGELRPIKPVDANDASKGVNASQLMEDAIADLGNWQGRLSRAPARPEEVFANEFELNAVRAMSWRSAAHWIEGKPMDRQIVASEAVKALRREAIRSADNGESMKAFRDLSVALRVIIECEPRYSLGSWVAWLELEREVLKEVEDISSRYPLEDSFLQWYEGALARCPHPTSQKIAGLILAESQGLGTLLQELNVRDVIQPAADGGPGRQFLRVLRGAGELVSVQSLQDRRELAEVLAQASSLKDAEERLRGDSALTADVEDALRRIENNYSFRQVAICALKVKRLGMQGAAQELAQLRKDYDYAPRLDETDNRKTLKLRRLNSAGEEVELEWLLQQ